MTIINPTQEGPEGIFYDFNEGCRIKLPEGTWRVLLRDLDTDEDLYDVSLSGGVVFSEKKYYVRFSFEVWRDGKSIFYHEFNARDKVVVIKMSPGGVGDTLAWIGHAAEFANRHGCHAVCLIRSDMIEL